MKAALLCCLVACAPAWRVGAKRNTPSLSNCPTLALVVADVALGGLAFYRAHRAYAEPDHDRVAAYSLAGLGLLLGAHLAEATCDR